MKIIHFIFLAFCVPHLSFAKQTYKSLNELFADIPKNETQDMGKLMNQIRMVPVKNPKVESPVFKVVFVEKGSVFERKGVKVGDLMVSESTSSSKKVMELNNKMKQSDEKNSKSE